LYGGIALKRYHDDDFMQFALYMMPRYMKRIKRYNRRHNRHVKRSLEDYGRKRVDYDEKSLIDTGFLMDYIKKNLMQQIDFKSNDKEDNHKDKNNPNKQDILDISALKKGKEKANKIIENAISSDINPKKDNTVNVDKQEDKDIKVNVKEKKEGMYVSNTKIKVRYAETDKMGIVHHSKYYVWFEVARDDFIKQIDITYKKIEDMGIMMPLVETYCKYVKPAKYGDNVIIKTSIEKLSPVRISLNYKVLKEGSNELLAKGKTSQTFIDNNFKLINIQKKYPNLWKKLSSFKDI
jgi:acyl-CoA thioester hydrolase